MKTEVYKEQEREMRMNPTLHNCRVCSGQGWRMLPKLEKAGVYVRLGVDRNGPCFYCGGTGRVIQPRLVGIKWGKWIYPEQTPRLDNL